MLKNHNIIQKLSNILFKVFFVDDKKYGIQQLDGTYKLFRKTITPATIDDMLLNQKSLLTYQELHIVGTAFIKWICIDVDIVKSEIDSNEVNISNLHLVKETTNEICLFLISKRIPYLLEFSGRRGFHIWIIFENIITKEEGFKLIEYIYQNTVSKFKANIVADKYPKTATIPKKSKGIGFGVKLPLSQNKASRKLSHFLENIEDFEFDEQKWLSKPNEEFLLKQYKIICSFKPISIKDIQVFIDEYDKTHPSNYRLGQAKKKVINSYLPETVDLDNVLSSLRKCSHIDNILKDFKKGLSRKDRSILVGLLIQLRTKEDPDFGFKLLLELFSKIQNFDEKKTKANIEFLKHYQPISCKILGKCESCQNCTLKSPIELIEGVELIETPNFSINNISSSVFFRITNALENYILRNDEVPLFPLLEMNKAANLKNIKEVIEEIFNTGEINHISRFCFNRTESNKKRILYSIDSNSNIISTYFTYILNSLFYSELSNNSYGYRLVSNFSNGNVFQNWFVNWIKYSKKIEDVLYGEEYKKYYLIKIDIKKYYDSIDILRLKLKLFEEAPSNIKTRLSELSEDTLAKYKHIINYLIDLSIAITQNEKRGVPQGPVFARYLAELYLIGLDNLVENYILINQKREFYYRFVDDIFIFIENEERAIELNGKISDWLAVNNLEINTEKSKIANVELYAISGEYKKYKDDVKYDINKVNKNKSLLSESEIQDALLKLEQLTDESKFGLKDNLRFFYYNFKDDRRIDFIRKKLANRIPFQIDGRGTLYLLFYEDLIKNYSHLFWNLSSELTRINGLSLTHYLNTILLHSDKNNIDEDKLCVILEKCQSHSDLTEADKLLLAIISLKYNLSDKYNCSDEIMNFALETPGINYIPEHWELYKKKLQNLDSNLLFLREIERIIKENYYTREFLEFLSEYSFTRFSDWSLKPDLLSFIDNEDCLMLYYNCLCFLTLFEKSNNLDIVKFSWQILENKKDLLKSNLNIENYWKNKLKDFSFSDFSRQSYNLVLSDKVGSQLPQNTFVLKYRDFLVTFLFAKEKKEHENSQVYETSLLEYIPEGSLFYKWVVDKSAYLYPEHGDICMRNIALNGIIVLKKGNKVFVKTLDQPLKISKYDYLKFSNDSNESELEYEFETKRLDDILNSNNLIELIHKLTDLFIEHEQFEKNYNTNPPYFYPQFLTIDSKPLIPYYSDFERIVTCESIISENNTEIYFDNISYILNRMSNPEVYRIVENDNKFNFNILSLSERFFPNSIMLINSAKNKIDFIKKFSEITKSKSINSIFQFQYYWTKTVYLLINESKLNNTNSIFINYFKVHFDHFDIKRSDIDTLFSISDNTILKDENLCSFINTIKEAIEYFQSAIQLDEDFNIINDIFEEIVLKTKNVDDSEIHLQNNLFVKSRIVLKRKMNYQKGVYEYLLKVNDSTDNYTKIYLYNNFTKEFDEISFNDIEIKVKKDFVFSYNSESFLYIYIPEDELSTCYRCISERFGIYNTAKKEIDYKTLELFPINHYFNQALNNYNQSDKTSIKNKLKQHYFDSTTNIDLKIVNWLSMFNKDSISGSNLKAYMDQNSFDEDFLQKTILYILNLHEYISNDDITFFEHKLDDFNKNSQCHLFPLKSPQDDTNGLFRLISTFDKGGRLYNFKDKIIGKFYTSKKFQSNEFIVIVNDIFLTGGQTKEALEYYLTSNFEDVEKLHEINSDRKNNRYFIFPTLESVKNFRENFYTVKKIVFLSAISTIEFKENIKLFFKDNLKYTGELDFICSKEIGEQDYLLGKVTQDYQLNLFVELIKDINLLKKILVFENGDSKTYKKRYCKDEAYKFRNLVLRKGSLPAKHIDLFTMKPKKGPQLLEYIDNWIL